MALFKEYKNMNSFELEKQNFIKLLKQELMKK